MVLEDKRLYLFECKHSVPPAGSHEMRDIWEDIEKAVRQLNSALRVLGDPKRLHNYLTGWFPGLTSADTRDLQIITCVMCSHRIFAGMTYEGIPIRDFSSLAKLTQDGFVGMGNISENGELLLHRYRLTKNDKFSRDDLEDYLSPDSRFFKLFKPFLYPVTRIVRCDAATVARETYVYEVDTEEWVANVDSLGLPRLADETREWKRPWSGADLLELLKARTGADAESPSRQEL